MKPLFYAGILACATLSVSFAAGAENNPPASAERSQAHYDLNRITLQQLSKAFPGIGKRRAQAIIAYREKHGAFNSVAELAKVKTVGESFVKKNLLALEKTFFIEVAQ
ncbi:MAG: helix-hairpin-helix domain-containing protein [Legionellaceae bacterium]|nr:helix-hairpin-helix domain-containing protein [Legionellaceae bacterium]